MLVRVEEEFRCIDQSFTRDFESLNEGVIKNFQKRNVSLLEFVDFFESYNESLQALNELRKARLQSYEELNNTVGAELFNK
jgi:cobalt-zinc-cadmium efflux system outer membrane protein